MTVYARIETSERVTILKFEDERVDHGWAILRWLEKEHSGERDVERDKRWQELKRGAN